MRRIPPVLLLAWLAASSAFGWGCEGHQIIALIARAHLTPAVSAAVDGLLLQNPTDPALARFCQDRPKDPMADSATWADDAKNIEKTALWHFVDIPLAVKTGISVDAWCPAIGASAAGRNRPGCITKAIDYELAILRDNSRLADERATALRYVIHLVGDIHQPLHDEDNNDQGGNCTALRFFSEERLANLHAVWDYKLIEHELEKNKLTQSAYAAALNRRFAGEYSTLSAAKADDPVDWAWETHGIAVSIVYGNLRPEIPVATTNSQAVCGAEREKTEALHIRIGDEYFSKAIPVVDERLATAGFRLALLLNNVLDR